MGVGRHRAQHAADVGRYVATSLELLHDTESLFRGRDFTRQQEPPERLDVRVVAPRHLRKRRERLRDRLAAEADPFERVEVRDVGDQAPHAPSAADGLADRDLADLDVGVLLEELGSARPVCLDLLVEPFLELCHRSPLFRNGPIPPDYSYASPRRGKGYPRPNVPDGSAAASRQPPRRRRTHACLKGSRPMNDTRTRLVLPVLPWLNSGVPAPRAHTHRGFRTSESWSRGPTDPKGTPGRRRRRR